MVKKHSVRFLVVVSLLSFFIGILISATTLIYFSIPDSFVIPATYAIDHTVVSGQLNVETITNQDLSIHFLELGNKYTGDCTLIKVGDTEILIDAGSRASSVPAIKNYLDQFVSDKVIEYVIVTHAHQDHIAGFGTSANVKSIFDLYDIGTVIQFVNTQSNSQVYKNYCRELDEVQKRCGTQVFTALQCVEQTSGARKIYNLSSEIKLEILDQKYYHSTTAKNENDNS
ncbi:MAG: MBL fold metallo-hydrolase, partial [Clostridia bacterium]|nr:MBL fold metallo-hydrolase [Clostridia bacterium]